VFCPTGRNENEFPKGFVSYENFKKIFNKIKPYAKCIFLYNWGEPFLNRDLLRIVSLCASNGISTYLDSNLSVREFNRKEVDLIVRSGLTSLKACIDGCTQATYEKYRVGGNFNRAFGNLKNLQQWKKRIGVQTPNIQWKFLVNAYNEHELLDAVRLAAKVQDIDDPSLTVKRFRTSMTRLRNTFKR